MHFGISHITSHHTPTSMDIDEEPNENVNTCSRESRRQFWISSTVLILIMSILYSASIIIYTSYTMVIDMDKEMESNGIRPIALYDTCSNPPIMFNTKKVNRTRLYEFFEILWLDDSMLHDSVHIVGSDIWKVFDKTLVRLNFAQCYNIFVLMRPVIY